ncbi:MAG: GspH/FimT family pseudopilin [Steroidobacteraceae bacterium]
MKYHWTIIRPQRGFTLVELMITLLVAGILTTVAVPSFSRLTMTSRLATQANDLVSAMSFTRSEAIKRNATLRMCRTADVAATTCAGTTGQWEHWIVRTQPGGQVVRRGIVNTYGNTVRVTSTLTSDFIDFGSDGLARASGGGLINASDTDAQFLRVCSTRQSNDNQRKLILGAGSRVTMLKESATC